MKSPRRGDFHRAVAVASESPCCFFTPALDLNLDTWAVQLSPLVLCEAGRSCQVYTGLPCCFSFVTLNGRRVPVLSDVCTPTCWGRFALLCPDPGGQGASLRAGWAHGPAPRGLLQMCPLSLSLLWPWGFGNTDRERELYWFASIALGDRYFEVVETGYKFRWSLRLGPAALKHLTAVQPASVSSEDLALVLPVEPNWHKRPFYFGPVAICAKSWFCWSQ